MAEYVSIKLPKIAKMSAELLRAEIIRRKNFENLEEYLKSDECPLCNHKLKDSTSVTIRFVKIKECPNCGFYKPTISDEVKISDENIFNILGIGLLFFLGLCLVAEFLKGEMYE